MLISVVLVLLDEMSWKSTRLLDGERRSPDAGSHLAVLV